MEGAAVLQIETVTENEQASVAEDPMATRWGINCTSRDRFVEAEKIGFSIVPFAKWFPVARFSTTEEIHSTDEDMPREQRVVKTALSAQRVLDSMLGGKTIRGAADPQKPDYGVRFGFHGENDAAKMAVISATLLPSLPDIHEIAARLRVSDPIDARCPGQDATDFAERQTCPTCWLQWIESDACDAHIAEIVETGMTVLVTDSTTKQVTEVVSRPTAAELATARALTTESLRRGIVTSQNTWRQIATELEKGERRDTDAYQNSLRKDIHAERPADANLTQVREYAKAVKGAEGNQSAVFDALAQSQIQTNALLAKIAEKVFAEPAVEAKAPAPKEKTNGK